MSPPDLLAQLVQLRAEGGRLRHRRLVVVAGERAAALTRLGPLFASGTGLVVTTSPTVLSAGWRRCAPDAALELLGTTIELLVLDLHDALSPNLLGALTGLVPGGGLLVLLVPEPARWPTLPDGFRDRLLLPPHEPAEVGRRFLARFLRSLDRAPGVLWVEAASGESRRGPPAPSGPPVDGPPPVWRPAVEVGPLVACCRTADQAAALEAGGELLRATRGHALVLIADRGRGKSSALGLLAAQGVDQGLDVLATGPGPAAVRELFVRAAAGLVALGGHEAGDVGARGEPLHLRGHGARGGCLRYLPPVEAARQRPDVLLVDEAAALPVPLLDTLLASARRVAFATTVHGYEGTGRGFDVRFRGHLEADGRPIVRQTLREPIRWAAGDPVEAWQHDLLLLDAGAATPAAVATAQPATARYRTPTQAELAADEPLLREAFGLLALAHYRTTPEDLARMLDAPNLATRLLWYEGHVVAVALVAQEGRLPVETCADLFLGRHRIRGHMLPETLVSHLGLEAAGRLAMARIVRVAVHPARWGQGLGRQLLDHVAAEQGERGAVLLGTGFAATAGLLGFWRRCGYLPIRLGVTRSAISGEHSLMMVRGLDEPGRELADELARRFARSAPHILADALRELPAETALAALEAAGRGDPPALLAWEWEDAIAAAFGHRLYDVAVRPLWEITRAYLGDPTPPVQLPARERQRLLLKVIQRRRWHEVAELLGEPLHECMRGLRGALGPLVAAYAPPDLAPLIRRFQAARAPARRGW